MDSDPKLLVDALPYIDQGYDEAARLAKAASVMLAELRERWETAEKVLKEKERFQTVNKELEVTRKRVENAAKYVSDYGWMSQETKKKLRNKLAHCYCSDAQIELRQRVHELDNAAQTEKRLEELDSKCKEMIGQIETRDQTIVQLQQATVQQLKEAADICEAQRQKEGELVAKASDLETRWNEAEKQRESLGHELQSIQNKHSETVAQLNLLIQQLQMKPECASTEAQTELDVVSLESRVCGLMGRNDALTTALNTMLETIRSLESTIEQLKISQETKTDELDQLESRVDDLIGHNRQLFGQLEKRDQTIDSLQDTVEQLDQDLIDQKEQLIGQLDTRDQTIATLRLSVQQLGQELIDQKEQLRVALEEARKQRLDAESLSEKSDSTREETIKYDGDSNDRDLIEPRVSQKHKDHLRRAAVDGHKCPHCPQAFKSALQLKRHKRSHVAPNTFNACKVCGRKFTTKSNLTTHERIHTKNAPFICDVCGKGFNAKCNLQSHLLTHMGLKPFQCTICGMKFSRITYLTKHLATHSGPE